MESPSGVKRKRSEMASSGVVMPGCSDDVFDKSVLVCEGLEGVDNAVSFLDAVSSKFADKPCVGEREVLQVHDIGNGLEKLSLSPDYTYLTYAGFGDRIKATAAGNECV